MMKKKPVVSQQLFAFWAYAHFPYYLGGHVTKVCPGGLVETAEYGPGSTFRPVLTLPAAEGRVLAEDLAVIRGEKLKAQNEFDREWDKKLKSVTSLLKFPEGK